MKRRDYCGAKIGSSDPKYTLMITESRDAVCMQRDKTLLKTEKMCLQSFSPRSISIFKFSDALF